MMLGLSLAITAFGSKGGIVDAPDLSSGAALLLGTETNGLAVDFTDLSMVIRDTGTPANNFSGDPNTKLTYSSPSTKYIRNSSGVYVAGTTLRTDHDASGNPLGLLIEPARTNLFLNSRSPATQGVSVTAQAYTLSFIGTGSITLTGAHSATLNGTGALQTASLTFTPSAGTLTCTVSGTIDFVQLEAGSSASSPIVTAGSTVTRAADTIFLGSSAFPAGAAMTLYAEQSCDTPLSYCPVAQVSDGGWDNRIELASTYGATNLAPRSDIITGAASQASLVSAASVVAGQLHKIAVAAATNSARTCWQGALGAEDTSLTMPTGLTTLYVGGRLDGARLTGRLSALLVLPRKMSNAELQAITT